MIGVIFFKAIQALNSIEKHFLLFLILCQLCPRFGNTESPLPFEKGILVSQKHIAILRNPYDIEKQLPPLSSKNGNETLQRNYQRFDLLIKYNRAMNLNGSAKSVMLDLDQNPSWYSPFNINELKPWSTEAPFHIFGSTSIENSEQS